MRFFHSLYHDAAALLLLAAVPIFAATPQVDMAKRQTSTDKLVFCHFMIGIVSDRSSAADYDLDMKRAKDLGIDAFALNIGVDPYTDQQLGFAYQSAADNGMKVFISFDFNWYHDGSDAAAVGNMIKKYGSLPAQLHVDDKIFASSFAGDGLDVATMRSTVGSPVFWAPNVHPEQGTDFSKVDGALNWMAWPNNGNNKAPTAGANVTVEAGDDRYNQALAGKPYIAPVSPWFSTHFGPEVSYSKNWVFPGDLLWYNRWNEILELSPRFIEIITWNDYGESHYIGPLSSKHTDDGNSKWVNDMPHGGWMDMAKPYIAAYKAGAKSANDYITSDQLIYWYRPAPASQNCDATDTTMVTANNDSGNYFMGRPNGWESMSDSVFVVSLLKEAGRVNVASGDKSRSVDVPAGASAFSVEMGIGKQQFSLTRSGQTVMSGTSRKDIIAGCVCGIYNFNAYVGTVPESADDHLGTDALASLTAGLHVSTCSPTPSLPPASTGVDATFTSSPTTTSPASSPPADSTTTSVSSEPESTSTTSITTGPSITSTTTPESTSTTSVPTTTSVPSTMITTTSVATTTSKSGSCTRTITTLTQLFPTNCLQPGDVWAGPPGSDDPDRCDGTGSGCSA